VQSCRGSGFDVATELAEWVGSGLMDGRVEVDERAGGMKMREYVGQ